MSRISLSVLIADDHLDRVPEVVRRLRDAGLSVDTVMDAIGTISGSIEASDVAKLSRIDGVASVEPSREYQLPPPDSSIQ